MKQAANTKTIIRLVAVMAAIMLYPAVLRALPLKHYAEHSVLSEGRWATVTCTEEGMHIVTDAVLRNLGFSDPSKVRVYGTGGAPVSEGLTLDMADDLTLQPSVKTDKGIAFYAHGNVTWNLTDANSTPTHQQHAYSEDIVYFLSDRDTGLTVPETDMSGAGTGNRITTFQAALLHEDEREHYGESGRIYVGEDFRATKSRSFKFKLPGKTDDNVTIETRFAAKTVGGGSAIRLKANGTSLPRLYSDSLSSTNTNNYGLFGMSTRTVPVSGNDLDLNIEYNYNGVLYLACLDYIRVFYTRDMVLDKELLIRGKFGSDDVLEITGCSAGTQIWDVTNPGRPSIVKYRLEGNKALLTSPHNDYREYVVFNPGDVTAAAKGGRKIANQDLHGMEAPDMLIITQHDYRDAANMIADMHIKDDGMTVTVLEPQEIYNEFSGGKKDVSAFRKLLKMWHDRSKGRTQFCLLMGKPTFDNKLKGDIRNAGYDPMPIWQSPEGNNETSSYSNDDYIGMLRDVEAENFYLYRENIHVAVGRIPVTSATEAMAMAKKIVNHSRNADLGSWRNKIMIIADDGDSSAHFNQAQDCYNSYRRHGNGDDYLYDRVYLDSYTLVNSATGKSYPAATERMMSNYNSGVIFTNYIGHASATSWGHENLFTWQQIQNMTNKNLTFIYAATCRFLPWDEAGKSGGEVLMLNPDAGVCGMIAATRTVYIDSNGPLNRYTCDEMFKLGEDGRPRPLGLIYRDGKNAYANDGNKLRYAFMGDPAMRINNIKYRVSIDKINDISLRDSLPEVPGGSVMRVSGELLDPDGNPFDFNGDLFLQLYDAESVIETYGNGNNGQKEIYNDRKNRLATCTAKVQGGKWNASIKVPMEISNNYSPALLSAYACDSTRREANGSSSRFYVYGFNSEVSTDTVGPYIEYFRLNGEDFEPGGMVNASPVVFARFTDPSGINISDAGVGHKISLRLDGATPYDDVAQCFTQDADGQGGTLMYGLTDVAPGPHTLTLEVWDNLNNSTRSSIDFNVNATAEPYIVSLSTDCNPATSGVNFNIRIDMPNTEMNSELWVYDLNGRVVWESSAKTSTSSDGSLKTYWNLCDKSGNRVPRGIYLYKALVRTARGQWTSQTNRLAVTAQ